MGKIKAYLPLIIFGLAVYLGIKVIPPYFNHWQFTDYCESEARLDTYNTKSEADIRRDVLKNAHENDIPITDDMLTVRRANGVYIATHYTIHIDIPLYPFDLNFNLATQNKDFLTK